MTKTRNNKVITKKNKKVKSKNIKQKRITKKNFLMKNNKQNKKTSYCKKCLYNCINKKFLKSQKRGHKLYKDIHYTHLKEHKYGKSARSYMGGKKCDCVNKLFQTGGNMEVPLGLRKFIDKNPDLTIDQIENHIDTKYSDPKFDHLKQKFKKIAREYKEYKDMESQNRNNSDQTGGKTNNLEYVKSIIDNKPNISMDDLKQEIINNYINISNQEIDELIQSAKEYKESQYRNNSSDSNQTGGSCNNCGSPVNAGDSWSNWSVNGPIGYGWNGNPESWPGVMASKGLENNGMAMSNHFNVSKDGIVVGGIDPYYAQKNIPVLKGGKYLKNKKTSKRKNKKQKGGFFQEIVNLGRGIQNNLYDGYYTTIGKPNPISNNPYPTTQPIDRNYKLI